MDHALIITQGAGWHIQPPRDLPVAAMMLGRPVAEAVALLPRLFNLCSGAQAQAMALALGLPLPDPAALRLEILRDHMLKLCVIWPRLLGLTPHLPPDWLDHIPELVADHPVLAAIRAAFAPQEAVANLPLVTPDTALSVAALENSVAARHAGALSQIEAEFGRGPYWRAMGVVADIAAVCAAPPAPVLRGDTAIVAAARGSYAVQARAKGGIITHFTRRTPTDHLCAGMLAQSLQSLHQPHLAPLVVDILSPCVATRFEQVHHA